jgi:hypothetical protein
MPATRISTYATVTSNINGQYGVTFYVKSADGTRELSLFIPCASYEAAQEYFNSFHY